MPADRLLITLLRALQTSVNTEETARLLSTAASLFTTLSNPRNLCLLTAQLLAAPIVWNLDPSLRVANRLIGTYSSAASTLVKHDIEVAEDPSKATLPPGQPVIGGDLSREEWIRAVTAGADKRSPTWKHVLVLAGLLLGFRSQGYQSLSNHLRQTLASALVKAVNASLEDVRLGGEERGAHAVVLALTYCFDVLDDHEKAELDYDRLLPALMGAAFFSREGYRSGYFFAEVDRDVVQVSDKMFSWSPRSPSFKQISDLAAQPLVTSMGALSKLIAYTIGQLKDPYAVQTLMEDLLEYSKVVNNQWRWCKLSEVEAQEEARFIDATAMEKTLPVLWRLLRSTLFSTSIVLEAVSSRVLSDRALANDRTAPTIATQTLHILRNLYFISARVGPNSISQHTFVYLTSIDIITSYPEAASSFIHSIHPTTLGSIPSHPLDRTNDLYFLNTAEHFTLVLPSTQTRDTLLAAASPYLTTGGSNILLEIFEAAHSLTLAVLSAPQNAELAAEHVPFYVDALFRVFPQNLSPRQFRLAFRTMIDITTPPSPLSTTQPELPEILLELVHQRVIAPSHAAEPRGAPYTAASADPALSQVNSTQQLHTLHTPPGTEKPEDYSTALVLTLIESLPYLPVHLLEEWLPRTAELIPRLEQRGERDKCRQRFWEVLSSGDMGVERSAVGVAWWGAAGGRELVLQERDEMMSGALGSRL